MHDSILQSIGKTPLVRLRRLAEGVPAIVAVKVESQNPGGSVKDRVGLAMIAEAERRGCCGPAAPSSRPPPATPASAWPWSPPSRAIAASSSCPTRCPARRSPCSRPTAPRSSSRATNVAPDSPDSYNGVADRLAREIPGAWRPNQFTNLANPEIHYRTTGPEIWEQTEGRITAFVAGVGTGGTISGVARYLKERNPTSRSSAPTRKAACCRADSPGRGRSRASARTSCRKTFNSQLVDDWVRVGDAESFHVARRLARREGMLAGGSSGTNVAAALRYARRLTRDDLVVALVCDTGRNYLSKFFDDAWLAANNLQEVRAARPLGRRPAATARAAAAGDHPPRGHRRRGHRPDAGHGHLATAGAAGRQAGRQHPGSDAGPRPARHGDPNQVTVGEVMARPLPTLESSVHLDEAYRLLLAGNTGVLALGDGKVVDIVTRIDLVHYWRPRSRVSEK